MSPARDATGPSGPQFVRPLVDFLHTESAGGVALVVAAVVALVWANSPWDAAYRELWHTHLAVSFAGHELDLDLRDWVNAGLMTLFFFVVGLEIKRELAEGELRDPRKAALPAIAAVGGMAVPAVTFLALNAGHPGVDGWGIPMATDIAIAVGVLSLLGSRVAPSLKLFLLALAIVDDIGAILVIAVFYGGTIDLAALGLSFALVVVVAVIRWVGVRSFLPYVVAGAALWLAVHESGIHATLVGVVLGVMAPIRPVRQPELVDADELADVSSYEAARQTVVLARDSVSVVEWLEHRLHPWTSFVVVPLFALANAGVRLSAGEVADAFTTRLGAGIVAGLVVGKLVGVTGFAWLATRLRLGALPEGAGWPAVVSVSALAGIGFTVSVFVAGLAFDDAPDLEGRAKVAILAASVLAGGLGAALVATTGRGERRTGS